MQRARLVVGLMAVLVAPKAARADTWTVIGYIAGDNDLEKFAVQNAVEMSRVGTGGNLKIVLQFDRGLKHSQDMIPGMGNFMGVRRLVVNPSAAQEVEDRGDPDMTLGATLADFIQWSIQSYPSDHYALVFWDHGAGWQGCCTDESNMKHLMPLDEIVSGISQGLAQAGRQRIELIGFDQCLMANLEVAAAIAPYGDVMVASEELEPGEGWDYQVWLSAITANPGLDARGIGRAIADGFAQNVGRMSMSATYTLSVLDLGQIGPLASAAGQLGSALAALAQDGASWNKIAQARANAESFGEAQKDSFGLIDLGHFANNLRAMGGQAQAAADAVLTAIGQTVQYKVAGPGHKMAQGVSIYLPQRMVDGGYNAVPQPTMAAWAQFLGGYTGGARSDTTPPQVMPVMAQGGGEGGGPVMLRSATVGNDIDQVGIVLATDEGGARLFRGELPTDQGGGGPSGDGGDVSYAWDGTWPTLSDGATDAEVGLFPVETFDAGGAQKALEAAPADVDPDGSGFVPAVLLFVVDLASRQGEFVGAFEESAQEGAGQLDLQAPQARVRPSRVLVSQGGEYQVQAGSQVLAGARLALPARPVGGEVLIGLRATDYAGNQATQLASVRSPKGGGGGGGGGGCSTAPGPAPSGLALVLLAVLAVRARRRR